MALLGFSSSFVLFVLGCSDDEQVDFGDGGTSQDSASIRYTNLVDAIEGDLDDSGAPGMAFALIERGEVSFARGFGNRHPETDEPVADTTLFRIGSVTKMLTAAGVLQQVEAGRLGLQDPVTVAIPEFDMALHGGWADSILVRHTLTHQAGLFDYLEIDADAEDEALSDWVTGFMADSLWLMAPPGRMWNYANPNYYLAGLLLERASGEWYRDAMDQGVLGPLGMERTYFLGEEVLADGDYASGDTVNWTTGYGAAVAEPDSYDNAWGRPAGYAWSSVWDLAQFGIFLLEGDPAVLSDDLRTDMSSAQVQMETLLDLDAYGYGLMVYDGFWLGGEFYDLTLLYHGGDIPGFAADLYLVPELEGGFVALSNADGARLSWGIGEALALLGLPQPVEGPDLSVDTATFADFVGSYDDPWNVGPLEVFVEDDTVQVHFSLLDSVGYAYESELVPYVPDNFIMQFGSYAMQLTFLRDASGDVEYARTRYFVCERLADEEASDGDVAGPPLVIRDRARFDEQLKAASMERWPNVIKGPVGD